MNYNCLKFAQVSGLSEEGAETWGLGVHRVALSRPGQGLCANEVASSLLSTPLWGLEPRQPAATCLPTELSSLLSSSHGN